MNMSQRARQMIKQWAVLFGLLTLLHILLFLGWVALEPAASRSIPAIAVLMIIYLVVFTAILLFFFKRLGKATSAPEYREAREGGLPATAKVLSIERTHWRLDRNRNFRLQVRPYRREYQMRVRVTGVGAADYETSLAEFLSGDQIPKKGDNIQVKVHPQRPEVIVMILDQPS